MLAYSFENACFVSFPCLLLASPNPAAAKTLTATRVHGWRAAKLAPGKSYLEKIKMLEFITAPDPKIRNFVALLRSKLKCKLFLLKAIFLPNDIKKSIAKD